MSKVRIVCDCGNVLGQRIAGYIAIRYERREVMVKERDIVSIRCERCGCVWWNVLEASDSLPDLREVTDALAVDSKATASG